MQADTALERINKAGHRVGRGLKVGLAAGAAGLLALGEGAKKSVEDVESLGKATIQFSRITGASTKVSSEWVQQAKVRGIESNALNRAFVTMAKQTVAAAKGTKSSADAFKALGVSQKIVKSGNFDQTIAAISDGLAKLPDGAKKAAVAQQLFGRQAQALMPLLNGGSKALRDQLDTVDKYGATLGGNVVEKVKESAEAQRNLKLAMQGVEIFVGTKVLPIVDKLIGTFADLVHGIKTGEGQFGSLHSILKTTGHIFAVVFGAIKTAVTTVANAISGWVKRNRADIESFGHGLQQIGAFIVHVFENVVLPVIRRILPGIKDTFSGVISIVKGAVKLISGILTLNFGKAWDGVKNIFSGALKAAVGLIRTFTAPIREALARIGGFIKSIFTGAWNVVKDGFRAMVQFLKDRLSDVLWVFQKILEGASHIPLIGGKFKAAAEGIKAFRAQLQGAKTDAEVLPGLFSQVASAASAAAIQMANANRANPHGAHSPQNRATGGPIAGFGGGDIIPAMLEPGEFVVRKEAVSKVGLAFMDRLNQGALRGFKSGGRAKKPHATPLERIQEQQALAALTPTDKDDIRYAQALVEFWQRKLAHAKRTKNVAAITDAATNLSSAKSDLANLLPTPDPTDTSGTGDSAQALIDALNAVKDQIAGLKDAQVAATNFSSKLFGTQTGVLMAAVTDIISGQLGARTGLGIQTPGFAGGRVRY